MNAWPLSLRGAVAVAGVCALLTGACHSSPSIASVSRYFRGGSAAGLGLQPVTIPDFSKMEPSVRQQMQAQFSSLKSAIGKGSSKRDNLAVAYGETGKLLMAAALLDVAEGCYVNAQRLAPNDSRWPYYLGHVYKAKGPIEKSVSSFERAHQLAPDDVATMVWLGDAYLSAGNADGADQLFARAITLQPSLAVAKFGAGRAALAKRESRRAVDQLKDALVLEPRSTGIHYPLAMAYQGLGDVRV